MGMVLILVVLVGPTRGSPHVRGDGPNVTKARRFAFQFSPRAWGWSGYGKKRITPMIVLPTCVGMVRIRA